MLDYKWYKEEIDKILDNDEDIEKLINLPNVDEMETKNVALSYVTVLAINFSNLSEIVEDSYRVNASKVIRAIYGGLIDILNTQNDSNNDDPALKNIVVLGDYIYAIYASPNFEVDYAIYEKTIDISTYLKVVNADLNLYSLPQVHIGVGIYSDQVYCVNPTIHYVENQYVFLDNVIGYAIDMAHMAAIDDNLKLVLVNEDFFNNLLHEKENHDDFAQHIENDIFSKVNDDDLGVLYTYDLIYTEPYNWADNNFEN